VAAGKCGWPPEPEPGVSTVEYHFGSWTLDRSEPQGDSVTLVFDTTTEPRPTLLEIAEGWACM
jgi:hypothetical protein